MAMIPVSVSDITPEWLNDVLPDDFGTVVAMSWEDLGEGVGILGEVSRIHLTYADGHSGPATVIAKCQSSAPENIFLCQAMGFYDREVNFYREAGSSLPVPVPRCVHADIAAESVPFVLLIEEIPDVTVMDQIEGAGIDQTRAVFAALATLHAHFWESDELYGFDWLPPMNNDLYKGSAAMAAQRMEPFRAQWQGAVDDATLDAVEAFIPQYPDFLDWAVAQGNQTLAHTDARCENYLFGADGDLTMIDFQFLTRFWGAFDIANWLGASLTTDDRRAHERELVADYHAGLVANGVRDYSLEQLWEDIRACLVVHAFAMVVTSDLDGANERGARLLTAMLERVFAMATDHDIAGFLASRG